MGKDEEVNGIAYIPTFSHLFWTHNSHGKFQIIVTASVAIYFKKYRGKIILRTLYEFKIELNPWFSLFHKTALW